MIRAVAVDLDGTLLNDDKEVSLGNIEGLRLAQENGAEIYIITGRSFAGTEYIAKSTGLSLNIICYNGAKVVNLETKETVFEKPLEEDVTKELVKLTHDTNIHLNLYQNNVWYVENKDREEAIMYSKNTQIIPVEKNFDTFDNYEMTKAVFIGEPSKLKEIKEHLIDKFGEGVYVVFSHANYLEVLNPKVNKALTLAASLKEKGIDMSECIAFGDAQNDYEMIKAVGKGVAMANAMPELKAVADEVTEFDNNNSGIGGHLKKYYR